MNKIDIFDKMDREMTAINRMRKIQTEPLQKKINKIHKEFDERIRRCCRRLVEHILHEENIDEEALNDDEGDELLQNFYEVFTHDPEAVHPGELIYQMEDFIKHHKKNT